jgi:hypothetical protein
VAVEGILKISSWPVHPIDVAATLAVTPLVPKFRYTSEKALITTHSPALPVGMVVLEVATPATRLALVPVYSNPGRGMELISKGSFIFMFPLRSYRRFVETTNWAVSLVIFPEEV